MARTIVYFAHPGQRFSKANAAMAQQAKAVEGITFVDLYAEYPRHEIDIAKEQARLLAHDVIVFQFPVYWYSTPSLLKEWQDLVLQHGFAYGLGGDNLAGKTLLQAITTGSSDEAYTPEGYQHYSLRDLLRPLEQTARLCQMNFATPYVLHSALKGDASDVAKHVDGYADLLAHLRDDTFDMNAAARHQVLSSHNLSTLGKV